MTDTYLCDIVKDGSMRTNFVQKAKSMGVTFKSSYKTASDGHRRKAHLITAKDTQKLATRYSLWYWHSTDFDFCLSLLKAHFRYSSNKQKEASATREIKETTSLHQKSQGRQQ